MVVPLAARTRRSCSSDSPSAFLSTQCRANDRNANAVSSSPVSTRGTGSRCVSAMPPRYLSLELCGRLPQQSTGDDELLDLLGALEDVHDSSAASGRPGD